MPVGFFWFWDRFCVAWPPGGDEQYYITIEIAYSCICHPSANKQTVVKTHVIVAFGNSYEAVILKKEFDKDCW